MKKVKTETLSEWLKRSYASFKQGSGLPEWVLPAHSFSEVVDEVGDEAIWEMSRPLKLMPSLKKQIGRMPPPDMVALEDFQKAVTTWTPISRVKPIIQACFDVRVILTSFKENELKSKDDVLRSICVLTVAPFSPEGEPILSELASILGTDKERPGDLIGRYVSAVLQSDLATLKRVSDCIKGHSEWRRWSALFAKKALKLECEPKLIAVTPPLSADIVWLLAEMIKEGWENESGRNHADCSTG